MSWQILMTYTRQQAAVFFLNSPMGAVHHSSINLAEISHLMMIPSLNAKACAVNISPALPFIWIQTVN